jgi:hypothetical protein
MDWPAAAKGPAKSAAVDMIKSLLLIATFLRKGWLARAIARYE